MSAPTFHPGGSGRLDFDGEFIPSRMEGHGSMNGATQEGVHVPDLDDWSSMGEDGSGRSHTIMQSRDSASFKRCDDCDFQPFHPPPIPIPSPDDQVRKLVFNRPMKMKFGSEREWRDTAELEKNIRWRSDYNPSGRAAYRLGAVENASATLNPSYPQCRGTSNQRGDISPSGVSPPFAPSPHCQGPQQVEAHEGQSEIIDARWGGGESEGTRGRVREVQQKGLGINLVSPDFSAQDIQIQDPHSETNSSYQKRLDLASQESESSRINLHGPQTVQTLTNPSPRTSTPSRVLVPTSPYYECHTFNSNYIRPPHSALHTSQQSWSPPALGQNFSSTHVNIAGNIHDGKTQLVPCAVNGHLTTAQQSISSFQAPAPSNSSMNSALGNFSSGTRVGAGFKLDIKEVRQIKQDAEDGKPIQAIQQLSPRQLRQCITQKTPVEVMRLSKSSLHTPRKLAAEPNIFQEYNHLEEVSETSDEEKINLCGRHEYHSLRYSRFNKKKIDAEKEIRNDRKPHQFRIPVVRDPLSVDASEFSPIHPKHSKIVREVWEEAHRKVSEASSRSSTRAPNPFYNLETPLDGTCRLSAIPPLLSSPALTIRKGCNVVRERERSSESEREEGYSGRGRIARRRELDSHTGELALTPRYASVTGHGTTIKTSDNAPRSRSCSVGEEWSRGGHEVDNLVGITYESKFELPTISSLLKAKHPRFLGYRRALSFSEQQEMMSRLRGIGGSEGDFEGGERKTERPTRPLPTQRVRTASDRQDPSQQESENFCSGDLRQDKDPLDGGSEIQPNERESSGSEMEESIEEKDTDSTFSTLFSPSVLKSVKGKIVNIRKDEATGKTICEVCGIAETEEDGERKKKIRAAIELAKMAKEDFQKREIERERAEAIEPLAIAPSSGRSALLGEEAMCACNSHLLWDESRLVDHLHMSRPQRLLPKSINKDVLQLHNRKFQKSKMRIRHRYRGGRRHRTASRIRVAEKSSSGSDTEYSESSDESESEDGDSEDGGSEDGDSADDESEDSESENEEGGQSDVEAARLPVRFNRGGRKSSCQSDHENQSPDNGDDETDTGDDSESDVSSVTNDYEEDETTLRWDEDGSKGQVRQRRQRQSSGREGRDKKTKRERKKEEKKRKKSKNQARQGEVRKSEVRYESTISHSPPAVSARLPENLNRTTPPFTGSETPQNFQPEVSVCTNASPTVLQSPQRALLQSTALYPLSDTAKISSQVVYRPRNPSNRCCLTRCGPFSLSGKKETASSPHRGRKTHPTSLHVTLFPTPSRNVKWQQYSSPVAPSQVANSMIRPSPQQPILRTPTAVPFLPLSQPEHYRDTPRLRPTLSAYLCTPNHVFNSKFQDFSQIPDTFRSTSRLAADPRSSSAAARRGRRAPLGFCGSQTTTQCKKASEREADIELFKERMRTAQKYTLQFHPQKTKYRKKERKGSKRVPFPSITLTPAFSSPIPSQVARDSSPPTNFYAPESLRDSHTTRFDFGGTIDCSPPPSVPFNSSSTAQHPYSLYASPPQLSASSNMDTARIRINSSSQLIGPN